MKIRALIHSRLNLDLAWWWEIRGACLPVFARSQPPGASQSNTGTIAMRILLAAAIWAALCVVAPAAPESPTDVFGVRLGAPLSLPACPADMTGTWNSATSTFTPVTYPECTNIEGVHFASGQQPVWVHFSSFNVDMTDGTVGKIEVFT